MPRVCPRVLAAIVLAALACSACQPRSPAARTSQHAAPAAPPAGDEPVPASSAAPQAGTVLATFSAYGPVALGATQAQVVQAWGGALTGMDGQDEDACHRLEPAGSAAGMAAVAFMIENDRFVRYDVRDPAVVAPGGGRIGMPLAQLQALYPQAQVLPHKYVRLGKVLRVEGTGAARLVFETGADGRVSGWRVGLPPQVDYVEGCG